MAYILHLNPAMEKRPIATERRRDVASVGFAQEQASTWQRVCQQRKSDMASFPWKPPPDPQSPSLQTAAFFFFPIKANSKKRDFSPQSWCHPRSAFLRCCLSYCSSNLSHNSALSWLICGGLAGYQVSCLYLMQLTQDFSAFSILLLCPLLLLLHPFPHLESEND